MKAMVFAAGLGTRLRPVTANIPKALVDVGGKPILERVLRRLAAAGVTDCVVNTHHFHGKIEECLRANGNFGLGVTLSREEEAPLETGGGLKKAAPLLEGGEPFFAYNADVWEEMDLRALYGEHVRSGALATLAVRDRQTQRPLLFDGEMNLRGRRDGETPAGLRALAFSGVQVLSPGIFGKLSETGAFSVTAAYLRLAAEGERIKGFEDRSPFWCDIGSLERLEAVRHRAGGAA